MAERGGGAGHSSGSGTTNMKHFSFPFFCPFNNFIRAAAHILRTWYLPCRLFPPYPCLFTLPATGQGAHFHPPD